MMNLRCPASSALSCITAWAVVAEPEKKSRTTSSSLVFAKSISLRNNDVGFGLSNYGCPSNKSITSFVPFVVVPTLSDENQELSIEPNSFFSS